MEPGPAQIDFRVVRAMCRPPVHHLAEDFVALTDNVARSVAKIFGTSGEVVILPCSGRGGIEAVFNSVDRNRGKVLIPSNGAFGSMMAEIARRAGHDVLVLEFDPSDRIPLPAIAHELSSQRVGIVGMVHCESSTGIMNEMTGLGALCHEAGSLLLVDAVSSLGGAPLAMDELEIDFCVSASQKALGAVTGLALVALSRQGAAAILDRRHPAPGTYLDLARWWQFWLPPERGGLLASGYRRFPFSMPVYPVFALEKACQLIMEEGLAARFERHASMASYFRQAMTDLGIVLFGSSGAHSPTLTALRSAPQMRSGELQRELRHRFSIQVAGPMGIDAVALRVGHMAESARRGPLLQTIAGIAEIVGSAAGNY